jgi:hypothetical protein
LPPSHTPLAAGATAIIGNVLAENEAAAPRHNLTVVALNTAGQLNINTGAKTDVVVEVAGFFF